ncbi:hypothetical protein FRACYDRAFT_239213 [Fragilariopsis cylindrus CCMP1102]|uniref:UFSP1/2/DUB catalytic domain-containing protein n=1 Tax=Fragilariopsis cylindrus CCMP1102 TaxID=635003 RepID=A0A1E7FEQ1_9STRA|nr:hypothetical protein FRACYDRAFT_239213 [Fragilariopsis cylindrus CCMP1102]|eukprot:OEU16616.1 hypothetical protein FRACYDRAFT_239213 [Fragilariopsis cylindrus CCMP1102]
MSTGAKLTNLQGEQQQQQEIIDLVDDGSDDEIENEDADPQQNASSTEASVSVLVPVSLGESTSSSLGTTRKRKHTQPQGTKTKVDSDIDVIDLVGEMKHQYHYYSNDNSNNNICSNDAAIAAAIAASEEDSYSYAAPAGIITSATNRSTIVTTSTATENLVVELGGNDSDNAILTHGTVENIQQVISLSQTTRTTTSSTKYYYWTCIPSIASSSSSSSDDNTTNTAGMIPGTVQHIQQKDQWSCGYRNYQMMLSAILPCLASSSNHMIYQRGYITRREIMRNTPNKLQQSPIILPSLKQTQKSIEDSWDEGFDPDGANHYRHKIVGKQSDSGKIGAMEVCNLFWYHGIDSVVIQFIKCYKSRQQLPYFIRNYFDDDSNSYTNNNNSNNNNNNNNNDACFIANKVLSDAYTESNFGISQQQQQQQQQQTTKNARTTNNTSIQKTKIPLYLQWEGHSVTIVGIEIQVKVKQNTNMIAVSVAATATTAKYNNDNNYDYDFTLLVLDPLKSNTQIILCTLRSMTYQERMTCCDNGGSGRIHSNNNNDNMHGRVITAAEAAVQKQINHYGR